MNGRSGSLLFTGLTGAAFWGIVAVFVLILGIGVAAGAPGISWSLLTGPAGADMFDISRTGLLPMIVGTVNRVFLMTLFVVPAGVLTAVYLSEYAWPRSPLTRLVRGAIVNLAGVPSIVFGLFGLGFFVGFVGQGLDGLAGGGPRFGRPGLLWASLTLAVMTLPVVIVATGEALGAVPSGVREAALALGATRLQMIVRVVLPQAVPGIITGAVLAVGRAAGEVAPILFTGAAFSAEGSGGGLFDRFMDLAYHIFILSTQSPDLDRTRPLLAATVLVLLVLTVTLNLLSVLLRARIRTAARRHD